MLRKHLVTDNGQVLLVEDITSAQVEQLALHFFQSIGGAEFFHLLTSRFYRLVADDPVIGPMFRGTPEWHARRLAEHYIRMYGTPDLSEGWDPRFLRAHLKVVIGTRHRTRWLELMRRAGEEIGAAEPWFSDFMATMTNGSGAVSAASRGAALARGLNLNRAGEVIDAERDDQGQPPESCDEAAAGGER